MGRGGSSAAEGLTAFGKAIVNPTSYVQFIKDNDAAVIAQGALQWDETYKACSAGCPKNIYTEQWNPTSQPGCSPAQVGSTSGPRISPKLFKVGPSSTLKYAPGQEPPPKPTTNYLPYVAAGTLAFLLLRS